MTIFERIKELADKQGKSLQKVSEELGFSSNYLYQLKRQTPAADKLALIADYFNVSVDYLLGRDESEAYISTLMDEGVNFSHYLDSKGESLVIADLSFFQTKHIKQLNEALQILDNDESGSIKEVHSAMASSFNQLSKDNIVNLINYIKLLLTEQAYYNHIEYENDVDSLESYKNSDNSHK